jgi:hypothetical protein
LVMCERSSSYSLDGSCLLKGVLRRWVYGNVEMDWVCQDVIRMISRRTNRPPAIIRGRRVVRSWIILLRGFLRLGKWRLRDSCAPATRSDCLALDGCHDNDRPKGAIIIRQSEGGTSTCKGVKARVPVYPE